MAPEQVEGDRPVDARTDIYGLGCVAYWLLTGKRVFEGRTSVEVMAHHLGTAPVPPSGRVGQPIEPEMEGAVLACLEKDPERRPQTALELASRLASVPGEPWSEQRAHAWWLEQAPLSTPQVWTGETLVVMPSMAPRRVERL
jgi:serine/threonine-protein kinase